MTREEAIKELEILKQDYWDDDGYGHETKQYDDTMLALNMAIKALGQELKPMIEIDLYSVIKQKYIERGVLDRISARIELEKLGYPPSAEYYKAIKKCLQIIDKYKSESEG